MSKWKEEEEEGAELVELSSDFLYLFFIFN